VRRQYEDELSTRAIFLAGADPSLAEAILGRWREELWLEERRLERQRDLSAAESAGSASDSTVGTVRALETRRLGHLAADLEFLDDLLLLADEPTGNLDRAGGRVVMDLIQDINESQGLTVFLVTHDPVFAACAQRVLRVVDGELQQDLELRRENSATPAHLEESP
jgi:ABC-type iron transport system FetAB ATPase subunit